MVVFLSSAGLAGFCGTPIILKQRRWGFESFFSMANKCDISASLTVIQMPDVALFTDRWAATSRPGNPFNNQIYASTGLCQTCRGRASSPRLCEIRVCLIFICLLLCTMKDTIGFLFFFFKIIKILSFVLQTTEKFWRKTRWFFFKFFCVCVSLWGLGLRIRSQIPINAALQLRRHRPWSLQQSSTVMRYDQVSLRDEYHNCSAHSTWHRTTYETRRSVMEPSAWGKQNEMLQSK